MKPNILFFTWHDAGDWFGCYGYDTVQTPAVDRLAAEGCRFTNTYSACAICSPSRAAMMTGRHPAANGVMFLTNTVNNNRLHRDERHLCRLLRDTLGYHTALVGVQHEAAHEHVSEILNPSERHLTDPWRSAPTSADAACAFLERAAHTLDNKPFYLQMGSYEAHLNAYYNGETNPNYPIVSDASRGVHLPPYLVDGEGTRKTVGVLQGLLHRGDAALARVLETLDRTGLADNTIVVMCVDHGVGLPRAKASCYDAGTRVGWIIRDPRSIKPKTTVKAMTHHVDTLPTLLDLAGLALPDRLHGHSFAAHARGQSDRELRDTAFSHMVETTRSIRTHGYRLIRNFRPPAHPTIRTRNGIQPPIAVKANAEGQSVELYEIKSDPQQLNNRVDCPDLADVRRDLDGRLWDFMLEHNDFLLNEPIQTPWQEQTRQAFKAHCAARGLTAPVIDS